MAKASLTGLLEPGLTCSIGLWGLRLTSAASAAIISSTEPVFIVLLAWLLFGNKPSVKLALCILVAVAGLLLVSADSASTQTGSHFSGDLLVVVSTLFAASDAAGLWLTLIPVFGVTGAYVWLGERPTVLMLLGMGLIVGAVITGRLER